MDFDNDYAVMLLSPLAESMLAKRLELQAQLMTDPIAMATIRKNYEPIENACALIQERMDAQEPFTEEEFDDAYGDFVSLFNGGTLALFTISGSMKTNASWWDKYFGDVSYQRMSEALSALEYRGGVKDIVFDWQSPGGQVKGVFKLADQMRALQKTIPMTSVATTGMMSAALVLGTVPAKVYATEDADVGSAGAISTFLTQVGRMKLMGIEAHVFKSERLKDIGSPYREPTKEEMAFFQARVDLIGSRVVQTVMANRHMTPDSFQAAAGDAKVVFGSEAAASGLVDGVKTLSEVVNTLVARHNASQTGGANTGVGNMKYKLNAKGLAAVEAGTLTAEEALKNPELREEAKGEPAPQGEPPASKETKPASDEEAQSISKLISDLVEAKTALAAVTAERDTLKTENEKMTGHLTSLRDVAATALLNLEVANGNTTATLESMKALPPESMSARYIELREQFKKKHVVGGLATTEPVAKTELVASAHHQAAMDAVGLGRK